MVQGYGLTPAIEDVLYQALETESALAEIYRTAQQAALRENLVAEWEEYLKETLLHQEVLLNILHELGMDPQHQTASRRMVRYIGDALLAVMDKSRLSGDAELAQLVATECVMLAERKDYANWEMIGFIASKEQGEIANLLQKAYDAVEEDQNRHLFQTQGWKRELWMASLGYPAMIPPPQEISAAESARISARTRSIREKLLALRSH